MDLLLSLTTTRRLFYDELSLKVPVNDQEAKKAIREMNGATIAGQEIKVSKEDLFFVFWNRFPISVCCRDKKCLKSYHNRLRRQSLRRRELTVVQEVGRVDTGTEGLEDTVTFIFYLSVIFHILSFIFCLLSDALTDDTVA